MSTKPTSISLEQLLLRNLSPWMLFVVCIICPICSTHAAITPPVENPSFCGILQAKETEKVVHLSPEISVEELQAKLQAKEKFVLLDVRQPFEHKMSHIPGSRLIPLGELRSRISELDSSETLVIYCRSGNRSAKALHQLQAAGFTKVQHLTGGILAWAKRIDPSVAK